MPSTDLIPQQSDAIFETVYYLYDLGISVVPQPIPIHSHWDYHWRQLTYTRVPRDHVEFGLDKLFAGKCQIGVVQGGISRGLHTLSCWTDSALSSITARLRERGLPAWIISSGPSPFQSFPCVLLFCPEIKIRNSLIWGNNIVGSSAGIFLYSPFTSAYGIRMTWVAREDGEPPTLSLRALQDLLRDNSSSLPASNADDYVGDLHQIALTWYNKLREARTRKLRRRQADALHAYARWREWPGKAGTTDKEIFLALVHRLLVGGSFDGSFKGIFRASERELAELAHRGRKAVHRSLLRLKGQGVIHLAGLDPVSRAAQYRFDDGILDQGWWIRERGRRMRQFSCCRLTGPAATRTRMPRRAEPFRRVS